ncbi:sensor histidine kinase YesM [Halobacillus andaensis]|uniref:histidine kinase n=1 Tax=Halobacillus andaensis TaxID=1176239 RepID=A0A917B7B8_HALAA|nr:sensor histidine kinase [Halobacillus andaensis]MBP2006040.1 two-component system sensor histidine kinase YesM [Halobacillus andaensis]GGF24069.1 sensor histidine kinase YesM [Halobacillus andaensis]
MKVKPFYSNFKIKDKIFSVSLLLLMIFGLLGLITYHYFTSLYEERIYDESADMLRLSSSVVDKELNMIEDLSFQVSTDGVVQRYIDTINNEKYTFEAYETESRLLERLLTYASIRRYISSMQVIDRYGEKHTTGFDTEIENDSLKIRRLLADTEGANVWTPVDGENAISSARLIRKKENLSLQNLGTLIISIDMDEFVKETLNFSPDNKDFVITSDNEIFYQSNEGEWEIEDFSNEGDGSGYTTTEIDGKEYLLSYSHSQFSQLTYHHLLPYDNISKQTDAIKLIMIVCFLLMLTLTILLSRRAANNISKPLESLSARMKKVQEGDFDESIPEEYYNDEIGELHDNFRLMLNRINELIKENYTKQLMIKETEYKALQAQINPHFLYNTLDSINWLAKINKQEKISVMADALGNMMRNIISKKAPMITIKEELEIVRNYITIQKYRYDQRLVFSLDIPMDYHESKIPKLSIQPIVENAIQHGLEEMIDECRISVDITEVGEDLEITVTDNGPGIEEDKLEGIYRGKIHSKSSGIGLSNINERIKMMFGDAYGITIDSTIGEGTKVRILLPFMTE